jgi:hypothetical protein
MKVTLKKRNYLLLVSSWLVQLLALPEAYRLRQLKSYTSQDQLHDDKVLQVLEQSGKTFGDTKPCSRKEHNDY